MRPASYSVAAQLIALLCFAQFAPAEPLVLSPAELDSLVAPIALYPDPLLAQILAAATYPLQVADAGGWLNANQSMEGEGLAKAAAKQAWDPSIQALVLFPLVLQRMDENLKWTTALGNAFLAQQEDVMLAVQRLRQKATASGALQSNQQQEVDVQQADGARAIVIQPARHDVVYIPAYNPTVIFGSPPVYAPYPAMRYPPPSRGTVTARAISFGPGISLGAALGGSRGGWHGGWGWGCRWGAHPALYVNSTVINHYGFRAPPYARPGIGAWAHNPAYRGAAPYSNAAVASRYETARAVAAPYGGAGEVPTPNAVYGAAKGSAARMATPEEPVVKTAQGTFTNPKPDPYFGSGAETRMNSQRGAESMRYRGTGGAR